MFLFCSQASHLAHLVGGRTQIQVFQEPITSNLCKTVLLAGTRFCKCNRNANLWIITCIYIHRSTTNCSSTPWFQSISGLSILPDQQRSCPLRGVHGTGTVRICWLRTEFQSSGCRGHIRPNEVKIGCLTTIGTTFSGGGGGIFVRIKGSAGPSVARKSVVDLCIYFF